MIYSAGDSFGFTLGEKLGKRIFFKFQNWLIFYLKMYFFDSGIGNFQNFDPEVLDL